MKKISIIIPVYNEEKTLSKIVEKLQKVSLPLKKELIIVNDSSQDNTQKIIDSLKREYSNIKSFTHEKNMGKGAALRKGIEISSGEIITVQDGDLEYNPEDYKKMIGHILSGEAQVVYGSRFLKRHVPRYKLYYYGNKFLTLLTKLLYNSEITDMETCYKMIRADLAKSLNLVSNKFDIEPEITSKILKKGYKIKEVPISYESRSFSEGKKINWKDGLQAIYSLIYWRIN